MVKRRAKVGEIGGKSIWKVLETELLPYNKTTLHLTELQVQSTPFNRITDNRIIRLIEYETKSSPFMMDFLGPAGKFIITRLRHDNGIIK